MGSVEDAKNVPAAPNERGHIIKYPRLHRGSHYADFMRDERLSPEVFHCIIQREGSKGIFSWTQHASLDAAIRNAELALTLIIGSTVGEPA